MRSHITLEHNDEVAIVPRRYPEERKPPFFICGTGCTNRHGESMNVISVLASLSPAGIKLFDLLVKLRDVDSNMVILKPQDVASPRTIQNHMPGLIDAGLVRRVKRSHFMINPNAVMPPRHRLALIEWNKLQPEDGLSQSNEKEEAPPEGEASSVSTS